MKKLIETADLLYQEAFFSKVNWSAHLIPLAKETLADFCAELKTQGLPGPHVSILSDDVLKGRFENQEKEIWGDSISIRLGFRPIPVSATAPVKGSLKLLKEEQASLVFSQSVSGGVIALIYPPSSEVAEPLKPYFMVDYWSNPRKIHSSHIKKLLHLMYETDIFCGAAIYPNSRGTKLLTKLQVKDAVLSKGGSRLWVWLQYVFLATKGVLRLHGIGKPTVP